MPKKPFISYKAIAAILSGIGAVVIQILNQFHIFFNNDIVANIITIILSIGVVLGLVSKPPKEEPKKTDEAEINDNIEENLKEEK